VILYSKVLDVNNTAHKEFYRKSLIIRKTLICLAHEVNFKISGKEEKSADVLLKLKMFLGKEEKNERK
jgi:hypothetical protein